MKLKKIVFMMALNLAFASVSFTAYAEDPSQERTEILTEKESDSTKEKDSEETVFVDNDYCKVSLVEDGVEDIWGYAWKIYAENKSDKNLTISVRNASINGVMSDPWYSLELMPNSKANETLTWSMFDEDKYGFKAEDITVYEFEVVGYDTDSWEDYFVEECFYYPKGEENVKLHSREDMDTDVVVIDNDYCKMVATSFEEDDIWGYTANLYVENKSDGNLSLSVSNATVNGFSIDPYWGIDLNEGKCAFSTMSWSTDDFTANGIEDVETIELFVKGYDGGYNDLFEDIFTVNP